MVESIYCDTGIFLDYLIYRSLVSDLVRRRGRRNRLVSQLSSDVTECFNKIKGNGHKAFTSSITYLEVEEAIYNKLYRETRGIPDRRKHLVMSARPIILQTLTICDQYSIETIDYSREISQKVEQNTLLKTAGVRAADSIHIVTALENNASIILSTDNDILQLNGQLKNLQGISVNCCDTEVGKTKL